MYEKNFKTAVKNAESSLERANNEHKFTAIGMQVHAEIAKAHAQLATATAIMHFTEQVKELRGAIEEMSDTLSRELSR